MILAVLIEEISKAATVLSVLMKVCTVTCNDIDHINVLLVLQICTDSMQVLSGASGETFPTSSDGAYDVGNIKFKEEINKKEEEEEEVNVKKEKVIDSDKEECMDIKEEVNMDIKEEVS